MIATDILIIGAGPTGLFTVFEAGLLRLKCHLIDTLPHVGGQCSEIYPKKPIYDIPGFPQILGNELIDNLMEQIKPFQPGFTMGERAEIIERLNDGSFAVRTNKGTGHHAPIVVIAGGLGSFEPRKPLLENLSKYEGKGISYAIKDAEVYRNKKVVIAGGGDSALDWTNVLVDVASEVTLVHRRNEFRGAPDSVEKVQKLKNEKRINLVAPAEIVGLKGKHTLKSLSIGSSADPSKNFDLEVDNFIPLFGFLPKLGPIADWGLEIERNAIKVDNASDY
ncbi:MAG: NAD(P)/FAD-dependent oxidoreductase, partial [Aurantibacter sp.]